MEEYDLPDVALEQHEVLKHLDLLPEGYRLVIRLHLMEQMAHQEIANSRGIMASTSRSQYTRALVKLRHSLMHANETKF